MIGCKLPPARPPPFWDSSASMDWFGFSQEPPTYWFGFPQENTLLQSQFNDGLGTTTTKRTTFMGFFTKQGNFPDYVKEHINMRNDSHWHWNNPTFDYYAPDLKKLPNFRSTGTQEPFE
ncbi:hypothetical protein DVH24_003019 [Malus domestica]|uniref:Uncharacterized protein n=1 Tax=Malus domestica TaxID=3750 RepID=A0A498K5Z1_MALDO|nr:hypothetical protein DVH24_003019 [Malus domestica]